MRRVGSGPNATILHYSRSSRRMKAGELLLKYRDIGVRVEDSFLLGETGLVRLSARVPRTLEKIEAFMAGRD